MGVASSRLFEALIGTAVVAYSLYAAYIGRVFGKRHSYSRSDHPWAFWTIVLIGLACGAAFLLGNVSWRT